MRARGIVSSFFAATLGVWGFPACARTAFSLPQQAMLGRQTGVMDQSATMRLVLALPLRDAAGAEALAHAVSDPRNPAYGKYITPGAFGARFGARAEDYAAVRAWASASGLVPGPATRSRTTISVTGTVATIERLFATRIATYRTPAGEAAFAPLSAPTIPDAMADLMSGVIGLSSTKRFAPLYRLPSGPRPQGAAGSGV